MYKKIKKTIINNYKWILCFICLVLFLALAEDVFNHEIMKGDIIGYKFISTYLINDSLTPIIKIITWFGSATCLLPLTLILLIAIKDKKTRLTNRGKPNYHYHTKPNVKIHFTKATPNRI